jgi:hypothetical protein
MMMQLSKLEARKPSKALLGGLLFWACAAMAQPNLPFLSLEQFDKPLDNNSIDSKGRETIAIYGDEVDLAHVNVGTIRENEQRTQDVVIVAKTLKLGPTTRFELTGQVAAKTLQDLRGGDLYLVADTLVVNGLSQGQLSPALEVRQDGGYNPSDIQPLKSRAGRTYVLVNRLVLAEEYTQARVNALNVSGQTNVPVPPMVLNIISRGFSPANSIHRLVKAGTPLLWSGLGDAYQGWLAEEPLADLVTRELNLVQQRPNPFDGTNIPDVVASMAEATKHLPAEILSPWYLMYLERNASLAQAAVGKKDYDLALTAIRNARPFTVSAPTQALTSARFTKAIADLQRAEDVLAQESVVEELTFPIDGGAPIRVTVIRDLAAGRVSVVPNQVLLSTVQDENVFRVGFMSLVDKDVLVNMLGRMTVDASVMALVRARFPKVTTEVQIADDLVYDTLDLGLGDAVKNGKSQVLGGGGVRFDLLIAGNQFRQTLLRLSQTFGVDATVNWKHVRLPLGNRTTRVNVSLGRTEMAMMGKAGVLTNATSQAVDVDYVLDGPSLLTKGFPLRVEAGKSFSPGCTNPLCYAPGSAIRRVLAPGDLDTWLVSMPDGSSVVPYTFENHLESDESRGGRFEQLVLEVTYLAAPGATPQQTGPFTLGRRGSMTARRSWPFIGSPAGGAKLEITGRAYWQNGYYDIPSKTVESTLTTIDTGWLKPVVPP